MESRPRVALLVTCLVDLFRPRVAEAAVRVLERAGCTVEVPRQTCCGQVNANSGDRAGAVALALQMARLFAGYDWVVVPSGSCAGQLRRTAPSLCAPGTPEHGALTELASRVRELTEFLHDVARVAPSVGGVAGLPGTPRRIAWHDSCSCLRDLGVRAQPRALLGDQLCEVPAGEECCGFGGLFSAKYPEISARIADHKLDAVLGTGADCLAGADLGCLLHLEGRLHRRGESLPVFHVAELLAGMTTGQAAGKAAGKTDWDDDGGR
jgi:L-lactate dehydrogenase complex protein LldE